ncbi:hypothetical protein R5H30_00070 [Sulfitobacter sp. D35]|uniref:hypothetical protein n=1 Tax=Sulfitobacter sp. D35 TaxID=3083252 RepID=UPI00296FAA40|nr:hypothetical protein [Sulfitobacter sp. D35]MDW4496361.1 hypothetical protein [Sulfitobacter sp. D35]
MTQRRRKAVFEANLVIVDGPQLFCLKAGKSQVVALAVPDEGRDFDHIAATVTPKNWERYIDGHVDLRYLFTYPFQRSLYVFSAKAMRDETVMLRPHENEFSNDLLPSPGFFSTDHTEEYISLPRASGREKLFIDGQWQLNEFGKFYQKYSDIYFFTSAVRNYDDPNTDQVYKGKIKHAFSSKPFKGGTSYMHMFGELHDCVPRREQLELEGIEYNSPGDVRMKGTTEGFAELEELISNFYDDRIEIKKAYDALRGFLSKQGLLTQSASRFDNSSSESKEIKRQADALGGKLQVKRASEILDLCSSNNLVFAKVLLSLYRRIESASAFFSEGRISFEKRE